MLYLSLILASAALVLALPIAFFALECVLALLGPSAPRQAALSTGNLVVLIPAHNEEAGIARTLLAVGQQLRPGDRLLVVADNCTDNTAEIARHCGPQVIERHDAEHRGKGFALNAAMQVLAKTPPDLVGIMDADCIPAPGTLEALRQHAAAFSRPAQAQYTLAAPPEAGPNSAISAFAFLVKNVVRAVGCERLGIPCHLRGTGMIFPWEIIRNIPFGGAHLVEDMQIGVDCALAGRGAVFCGQAHVTGVLPVSRAAAIGQRKRWEHGHLNVIFHDALPLLRKALVRGRLDLIGFACDLMIPPLSLLVVLWALIAALAVLAAFAGQLLPLYVAGTSGLLLALGVGSAWLRYGRETLSLSTLLRFPLYIAIKIPLYLGYVAKPQREWIRTDRDAVPTRGESAGAKPLSCSPVDLVK